MRVLANQRGVELAVASAVALAAVSLALPYMPVYDPWAWLVWGRELASLDLATAAGPSWKPLPVLIDAPLSLLGTAAPRGWLLIARSGWLLAPLLAGLLAARLAGAEVGRWRFVAAALAAGSVALTGDAFTPPARQFAGGLSEPLLVALVLGAVVAVLERRAALALWLGVAASLLRPECWPFLAAWAIAEARREPRLRAHAVAFAVAIPVAWFVPDMLASGNPLEGAQTARNAGLDAGEGVEVVGRALAAPLAAAWAGVALLLAKRRREADRPLIVLLAAAAAWIGLVAAMSVLGYAGLPRFLAPATAIVAILGGVGVARAGARGFTRPAASPASALATVAILLVAVGGFLLRAGNVPGELRTVRAQTSSLEDLFELAERLGPDRLLACGGRVRVAQAPAARPEHAAAAVLAQTALAWELKKPIEAVRVVRLPRYGVALSTRSLPGRLLGRAGPWRATQLPCR